MEKQKESNPKRPTNYIIYWVGHDIKSSNGKTLKPGYYRILYDMSGMDYPHDAQYSINRREWSDCGEIYSNFQEFHELFDGIGEKLIKFERMEYVETITYKGCSVPVFIDDCGQCFFCIFNNKEIAFGSFQSNYEEEVREMIEHAHK